MPVRSRSAARHGEGARSCHVTDRVRSAPRTKRAVILLKIASIFLRICVHFCPKSKFYISAIRDHFKVYTVDIILMYTLITKLSQTVPRCRGKNPQTTETTQKAFLTLAFGSLLVLFWEPFHKILFGSHHCFRNILRTFSYDYMKLYDCQRLPLSYKFVLFESYPNVRGKVSERPWITLRLLEKTFLENETEKDLFSEWELKNNDKATTKLSIFVANNCGICVFGF